MFLASDILPEYFENKDTVAVVLLGIHTLLTTMVSITIWHLTLFHARLCTYSSYCVLINRRDTWNDDIRISGQFILPTIRLFCIKVKMDESSILQARNGGC
jgi:hypothetical protein